MSFMATVIQKQSNVSSRSGFSLLPHICMWVSRLMNLVIIVKESFYVPRLHCVARLMQIYYNMPDTNINLQGLEQRASVTECLL